MPDYDTWRGAVDQSHLSMSIVTVKDFKIWLHEGDEGSCTCKCNRILWQKTTSCKMPLTQLMRNNSMKTDSAN